MLGNCQPNRLDCNTRDKFFSPLFTENFGEKSRCASGLQGNRLLQHRDVTTIRNGTSCWSFARRIWMEPPSEASTRAPAQRSCASVSDRCVTSNIGNRIVDPDLALAGPARQMRVADERKGRRRPVARHCYDDGVANAEAPSSTVSTSACVYPQIEETIRMAAQIRLVRAALASQTVPPSMYRLIRH